MAREYRTIEELLERGREIIGILFRDIDKTGRLRTGKGAIGTVIEESWFELDVNNRAEADFSKLGVELKATPYVETKAGLRAKERLVCNLINYMEEHKNTFFTSSFWKKCNTMILMFYEHIYEVSKEEFFISETILFRFPPDDLVIIAQDWLKIVKKIRDGKAHELSEGDTLYLGACTKGATSADVRQQPFSDIPAKPRAYSLKQSYMTYILNNYVFGDAAQEHIVKDPNHIQNKGLEGYINERLSPYFGRTQPSLLQEFNIETSAKNTNELILARILGIRGRITATEEFQKAGIIPKTIRIQRNGHIKENMSFPAFRFLDIIQETWEESDLKNYLEPAKFLFVIFKENDEGEHIFERIMFWNIPAADLDEVRLVWERTVQIIKDGVTLERVGNVTCNNFPKQSENRVAHVRPHARNANDTFPLPDGRSMTKQCFWLNRKYVESVVLQ